MIDISSIKKLISDKEYKKALDILIKSDIKEQTPEIKGLIGVCLYELKIYEHAKNYLIDSVVAEYKSKYSKILEKILTLKNDTQGLLGLKLMDIEHEPDNIYILRDITKYAKETKNYNIAIEYFNILLKKDPKDYVAWNNLGLCHEEINELDKAYNCYKKSLSLNDFFSPNFNLGIISRKLGKDEESIKYLKKAILQNPESKNAKYSLSMSYLMLKDFKNGYPLYSHHMTEIMPQYYKNEWDGKPHKDKTVCVFMTGGFGDMIMFARYLKYLKDYFKKIYVLLPKELHKIFKTSFPYIEIINSDIIFENYDYATTPMHILKFLNLDFNISVPDVGGYLKVGNNFKKELFKNDKLKIGINFHGNRKITRTFFNRSCPLECFEPIFESFKDKAIFYSIQKDESHIECEKYPFIVDLYNKINDFNDTAMVLKNLDFLITIDSSPLHLAGALNVKTYALLPYANEWRWFKNTDKSIWYNSVELFRQDKERDWISAIQKLNDRLNSIY